MENTPFNKLDSVLYGEIYRSGRNQHAYFIKDMLYKQKSFVWNAHDLTNNKKTVLYARDLIDFIEVEDLDVESELSNLNSLKENIESKFEFL